MSDEHAVMLREISSQAEFVRASIEPMYERALAIVRELPLPVVGSVFAIGCGDSFCAALAARASMMSRLGRWVEPVEAQEFSGYLVDALPPASLVFGVSNSGSVTRTIEGVRRARERGAWTVALTAGSASELARTAETVIEIGAVPNIKRQPDGSQLVTPGTITYTASLLGLVMSAIALGVRLESLSAAAGRAALAELHALADTMSEADAQLRTTAAELVATLAPQRRIVIVGGGPNAATAYYAMAKFFEAVGWPVHHAQIEEWAHEHYFLTGLTTDTIVIAPPGAARARGLEHARAAREMGSRTIVIGAAGDDDARAAADAFVGLPAAIPEPLTPFVYKLPFDYLTHALAVRHETSFFGFADPARRRVNFQQIFSTPPGISP